MKATPVALLLSLGVAGCATTADVSREPVRITVSAANYSEVSGKELHTRVNAPENTHPTPPAAEAPSKPLFYAFVPVDYTPEVPLQTILRELAIPLAHRGYFNVVYQVQAGLPPTRLDYLLRIYCGRRYWRTPIVRTDRVTWGNAGLVYAPGARSANTANILGAGSDWDPRAGTTPLEIAKLAANLQQAQGGMVGNQGGMGDGQAGMGEMQGGMGGGRGVFSVGQMAGSRELSNDADSLFYWLILIEAFKYDDLKARKADAPCVWAALAAAPYHQGLDSVGMIRTVARTAMPYFGATTDGLQVFEVPPETASAGESAKAPGQSK